MADWFKFYENDLDETRLQYAVSQLPEVIPVWVGILSECCRHKVGTVSWGRDEIEMFGFSKRLNVSIPKVNEAVKLLAKIRYITLDDDHITVIKWDAKQSEYCQKRTKQQNQTGANNPMCRDSVGIVSGHSPVSVGQEERRGEEKRGDSTKLPATPAKAPTSFKCSPAKKLLIDRLEKCLGLEWENDRQKWMGRIIHHAGKSERVIAEIESAAKEKRISTTSARYAEQIWKEFR